MHNINRITLHREFSDQIQVKIKVDHSDCPLLISSLLLAREKLQEVLILQFGNCIFSLKLSSSKSSVCVKYSKEKIELLISNNSIGYIISYLLRFFRDSVAPSEHIDIDFEYLENKEFTLTIETDNFVLHDQETMNKFLKD
jgi:hypothetical protein